MKKTFKTLGLLLMTVLLVSLFSTGALAADGPVPINETDTLAVCTQVLLSDADTAAKQEAEANELSYDAPACSVSVHFGDDQDDQLINAEDSLNFSTLLSSDSELIIAPPEGYYVSALELSNDSERAEAQNPLLKKAHVLNGGASLSLKLDELTVDGALDGAVLSAAGPAGEYTLSVTCSAVTGTPVVTYGTGGVTLTEGETLVENGDSFEGSSHSVLYPKTKALYDAYWQGKTFSGYLMAYDDGPTATVSENSLILPYGNVELTAQWADIELPHFTITADSGSWEFDGTMHSKDSYSVSPDPADYGYTLSNVVVTGNVTSPAEADVDNRIESFVLTDPFNVQVSGAALSQMVDTVAGKLSVSPRSLTVTAVTCDLTTSGETKTASSISTQNGVYQNGYHAENLLENHELVGDFVTGSGKETFDTAIDESKLLIRDKNTHETVDKTVFYSITTVPGKVTITSIGPTAKPEPTSETKPEPTPEVHDVVITLKSGTWTYDGQAHHQPEYEITGLVDGDKVQRVNFNSSSVITDVGSTVNDIQSIDIVTSDGKAVSDGKYKVSSRAGVLKVNARNITVTAISGSLTSNGSEIFASSLESPDHEYQNGYKVEGLASGHKLSGSFVQGNGKNGFQTWIDTNKLTVLDSSNRDVTSNYAIHTVDGYITINIKTDSGSASGQQTQSRVNITVSAKSGSFVYDGKAHTLNSMNDFTVSGLVDGDQVEKVTFKSTSTITNVGTQNNEIQSVVIKSSTGAAVDSGKYNITYVPGKLTVTKFPLTLTAVSDSKTYDGKALNNKSVKSTALANSEHKLSADYDVYDSNGNSIKNGPVDVGVYVKKVSNVRITAGSQDVTSNYDITTENGTLTILTSSGGTSASTVSSTAYYGNTYTIRSEAPYSEFQYLLVDGQKVPTDQYTVKEGSTIITLKASYIQGLKTGSHNYSIVSTSRQADGSFTVSKAPKTSDGGLGSVLWIVLLLALLLVALILWFVLRRSPGHGGSGRKSPADKRSKGSVSQAPRTRQKSAVKKPVSDTVMDFESFFGNNADGRPRRDAEVRDQVQDEEAEHDPTKDLLPNFRIDLDAYRKPLDVSLDVSDEAFSSNDRSTTDFPTEQAAAEDAVPLMNKDTEGTAVTENAAHDENLPPDNEEAEGELSAATETVDAPDAAADTPEDLKTDAVSDETEASSEAADPAEKTVGELSMDEFLAGFAELMPDVRQNAQSVPEQEPASYVGRHIAGAGQKPPASSASSWYHTQAPEASDK